MSRWRDIKAKARASVHTNFEVPAVYLTHATGTPLLCGVRIHTKISPVENEFTWPSMPGYLDIDPYVIFQMNQVSKPLSNSYLIVSPEEVYKLGVSEPSREGFIKTMVVPLKENEIASLLEEVDTTDPVFEGII